MQVILSRSLLVLLACTSATRAIPTIEMRADNAVNAPNADQMAAAQAHAAKFEEAHQEQAKQFADALAKSNDAAKAAGTNLDIGSIFGKDGLDLSGIKLPDIKVDTSSTDTKAADDTKKADKPPAVPYPWIYGYPKAGLPGGFGYGGGGGGSYCWYYPQYPGCSGGGGYNPCASNPYLYYYYPQYCGGGGAGGYFPYPNPYGVKVFEGPTGCGDIKGTSDSDKYGFICSDAYDTVKYCTVNPSGSFDYQKCGGKGCCGALDDGSYGTCLC